MVRAQVILDEYTNKRDVPKTTAKKVYKLTEKELGLLKGKRKCHGRFHGTVMTLYSRSRVISLACKKYGCTRKNIAEVLAQDKPPIVTPLIEKPKKNTPEKKKKAPQEKTPEVNKTLNSAPASPILLSDVESDCSDSD